MQMSPRRVVARYLEARVVRFRRDREYAAYNIFVKQMKQLQKKVDTLETLLDQPEMEDLLYGSGGPLNIRLVWDGSHFLRLIEREVEGRKDIPIGLGQPEGYYQEKHNIRKLIVIYLKEALERLERTSASELADLLKSSDFDSEVKYALKEGLIKNADVRGLKEGVDALNQIRDSVEYLLKRIARERESEMDEGIPATAEMGEVETLYHASVNAKPLFQKGFSDKMPAESSSAGLGGSQSLGLGRGRGISFTDDRYVAKEIARVFKEVAMIARGDVQLSHVLEWVRRSPHTKKIMEWYQRNYMPCGRECSMSDDPTSFTRVVINDEHVADVKAGRAEYDPRKSWKHELVPYGETYPGREGVMGLYLSYLNYSGRYDPKFFRVGGPKGLVKRFKGLNPKNIGFIEASVNTAHPDATYGKGEREVRVPPEAVLSVDKFIG